MLFGGCVVAEGVPFDELRVGTGGLPFVERRTCTVGATVVVCSGAVVASVVGCIGVPVTFWEYTVTPF